MTIENLYREIMQSEWYQKVHPKANLNESIIIGCDSFEMYINDYNKAVISKSIFGDIEIYFHKNNIYEINITIDSSDDDTLINKTVGFLKMLL